MDQEAPGFWAGTQVVFPVVRSPGAEFLREIGVRQVPLALRIGPGGVVEDVILGVADQARVSALFGLEPRQSTERHAPGF
jgi:hypothetical protein